MLTITLDLLHLQSQSVLSRADNDRRQLEERLASCQASLADLRRQKEQASEAKQKAQQDLANAEIRNADLEMKLKALRGVSSHDYHVPRVLGYWCARRCSTS